MGTVHRIVFGDCQRMVEMPGRSAHLMVTSPPYYNAPFDYPGLFKDYEEYLGLLEEFSRDLYRVLVPGRIACFVTDDMLVDGQKFPVVADTTRIMLGAGFRYRDRITWVKPKGYVRISRRSGVVLQHPYPMYFYPDNIQESILVFQKGRFDYSYLKKISQKRLDGSRIERDEYNGQGWALSVWNITNVLPLGDRVERGVAAFPEEIPRRLIKLYSFVGETVLDPFLGSGTTTKVAMKLGRNSWGFEKDAGLRSVIEKKLGDVAGGEVEWISRRAGVAGGSERKRRRKVQARALPV